MPIMGAAGRVHETGTDKVQVPMLMAQNGGQVVMTGFPPLGNAGVRRPVNNKVDIEVGDRTSSPKAVRLAP
mgnify:CR=1 FL=1